MTARIVHVVGAGLAGLSAAIRLAEAGERVVVHETAKAAGGRCRSYHDATLGLTIDNGNHLLLSANRAALGFSALVGGTGALTRADAANFDFADLGTGERWRLRVNPGRVPWWILIPSRRVPGTSARDYLAALPLLRAGPDVTLGDLMRPSGPLWDRLWHPVLLAALNTEPERASASLTAALLRETLAAGGRECVPIVATGGLSAAFVDPAVAFLRERGAAIRFGARLRAMEVEGGRARRLAFADGPVEIGPADAVVLAVPAPVAGELLPGLPVPATFRAIVNLHYGATPPPGQPLILGIVGGLAEWLFAYPDRLSVTISAADRLLDTPRELLAADVWSEVARLVGIPAAPLPPWQVVKERRATFAALPSVERERPAASAGPANVALAGDWVATGLPATIEGAIRSGETAATLLRGGDGQPVRPMS